MGAIIAASCISVSLAGMAMAPAAMAVPTVSPSASAPTPVAATVGGGISLRPMTPVEGEPSSAAYFTLHGAAGSAVHDSVWASNASTATLTLVVSPVDGLTGATSGSVFANRDDVAHKSGAWVVPSITTLTLAPGAAVAVPFTVNIPAGAPAGDHLAGIAFENSKAAVLTGGFQIKQVLRSVIGVLTIVPGTATFVPSVTKLALVQIGTTSTASVTVGVGNAGLHLGKPVLTVILSGPSGYQKTVTNTLDTVLPGDTISYPMIWPDSLATGNYTIAATLAGGTTTASMTSPVHLGTKLVGSSHGVATVVLAPAAKSGTPAWILALAGAAVVIILLGLVGGFFVMRRLRALGARDRSTAALAAPIASSASHSATHSAGRA